MKLSQLAAEAAARLADLRSRLGQDADAECFVSLSGKSFDEKEVHAVEIFLGVIEPRQWYFEIKTDKEPEE